MRTPKQSAFTLVELAIVLVIIGLIVGGVLVGQDLINAAKIRATVSDIEKYNAAATTFREKYSGLPGDLLNTRAVQFGFNTAANDAARDGTLGHGDGNNEIYGCDQGYDDTQALGCETTLFWVDLSRAGLVPMRATSTSINATGQTNLSTAQLAGSILPTTKLRDTALVSVFYNYKSTHLFGIGELSTTGVSASLGIRNGTQGYGLTPLEATAIDQKLDDGEPLTGAVFSMGGFGPLDTAGSNCVTAGGKYNTVTDILANTDACAIAVRSSF